MGEGDTTLLFDDQEIENKEIDRAELPSLFSPRSVVNPTTIETHRSQIPGQFEPMVQAASVLCSRNKQAARVWIHNQNIGSDYDYIRLWSLPKEWGPKGACKTAPMGQRRAISIHILYEERIACLLGIENRPGSSAFGFQVYMAHIREEFPNEVIASILHWRLTAEMGWPKRETHKGDFRTHGIKRAPDRPNAADISLRRLSYRLRWLFDNLEKDNRNTHPESTANS